MVPDHQVRRKWSGDASKKVQLFKVGGSRIIGTAVKKFTFLVTSPEHVTGTTSLYCEDLLHVHTYLATDFNLSRLAFLCMLLSTARKVGTKT